MVLPKGKIDVFEVLKRYSNEVVKPHFGIDIQNSGYTGNHVTVCLPSSFSSYENTNYYYKGKNRFIHYTSLESFFYIINNGYFIASQLSSLNDPLELIFAGKRMSEATTRDRLDLLKRYLFSFSMCIYQENSENNDSFKMWNMYGRDGHGVGMVFSFYENIGEWNESFLSEVYYDNEESCLDKFTNFSNVHNSFMKKYPELEMRTSIKGPIGASDTMALFLPFHKSRLYKEENEIRYLKSFINDSEKCSAKNESIGIRLNKQKELEYFYKIPIVTNKIVDELCSKNGVNRIENFRTEFNRDKRIISSIIGNKPFVVLEKIIIGYKYTYEDFSQINSQKYIIEEKLNSSFIDFELSEYSKEFYES